MNTNFLKQALCVLRCGNDGKAVFCLDHKISIRYVNLAVSLNSTDQQTVLKRSGQLTQRHMDNFRCFRHFKAQHFDSSAGKAVDLNRRWEPQQSCHFHGGRVLRVDDHGQTQLFTNKFSLLPIHRISNSGDGVTVCCLFGDDTTKQVHFITFGYGNHQIRMLNICLLKHLIACSVSYNSHNVVGVGDVADDNTVCVNDRHKVVLAAQLGGQCGSDFSAAHNDNFHVLSLQCKSISRKIVKTRQAAS